MHPRAQIQGLELLRHTRRHARIHHRFLSDIKRGDALLALVVATVHDEQEYHESGGIVHAKFVVRTAPGRRGFRVALSAVLCDGRTVDAENVFGVDGALGIARAEVGEQIDRLLGRAPDLHSPRVLAWRPLTVALEGAGVICSEAELIATPFEVRFAEPSAPPAPH
jgi:hypothetical protein